jgi:hypothetical protein
MKVVFRIIFYGIFIAMLSACAIGENKNVDDSNWKETYATLYRYGYGRGAVSMIFYWVDRQRYEVNGSFSVQGKVIGDKYLIKYNPDNPKQIKEYTWNVGFLKTEKTVGTFGIINGISSTNLIFERDKDMQIVFTYTVNGKEYQRSQDLQPDYKEKFPNLLVGQRYKVLYWDKNPQRAVLYLDKPIKQEQ